MMGRLDPIAAQARPFGGYLMQQPALRWLRVQGCQDWFAQQTVWCGVGHVVDQAATL